MKPFRRHAPMLVIAAAVAALSACGTGDKATPQTAVESPTPTSTTITLARWVGVTCSPEGSHARSRSGGDLVCKQVGHDVVPEWHAAG